MKQQTFASGDFERFRKPTRREQFLAQMDKIVPWSKLYAQIEPFYPKAGNGRPPVGLERMLRIYFLQHWFNLSDPGAEEALYESRSMCRFAGIDLGREPVPDESTILNFRHLLERHELGEPLFQAVGEYLQAQGLHIASGTIVERQLQGETLRVDTGCLVAFESAVDYSIERAGNLKSMFFGGEGLFLATLGGHGRVWMQSLPFSRLADRILAHAPKAGGSDKGEG